MTVQPKRKILTRHFVITCYNCQNKNSTPMYQFFRHPKINCKECGVLILSDESKIEVLVTD